MSKLSLYFKGFLSLFLTSNCPLCDRSTREVVCQYCARQLQHCQVSHPDRFWKEALPMYVWGRYEGALKRAIAALKYENQPQLAQPLGQWLGESWLQSSLIKSKNLAIVPIPMYPEKQQKRGFNQAELLAQSFCDVTRLSLQKQGLERIKSTEAQFGLSPQARQQNLNSAFRLGKGLLPQKTTVLLLDDIYTTGATALSAAQTLRQQGINVEGILAIATTKRF